MALGYVPPVYMWIVTYTDDQALPQFDPETGKENRWASVDQSRVKSVGWFPISNSMADKILVGEGVIARVRDIPRYEIHLKPGQRPYMRKTRIMPTGQYRLCLECGAKWIFSLGEADPSIVRQGYPWHSDHKYIPVPGGTYRVAVCPSCGYHNLPTDTKEEQRIVRRSTNMEYAIYKIGVQEGQHFKINEWGEVINK